MKNAILSLALAMSLGVAGPAVGHEKHAHKVMGHVIAIDDGHIEIQGKDGKKVTGLLGPKTKFMSGKRRAAWTDVTVGQRVVVTVMEQDRKTNVTEVLLGITDDGPKPSNPER